MGIILWQLLKCVSSLSATNYARKMLQEFDVSEIVEEIAKKEGVQNAKFEQWSGSNKGDNYLGIIKAVAIIGTNKRVDLIFKYPSRSVKLHEEMPLDLIFLNEINFYNIIPILMQFQQDYNIKDSFDNVAKCYATITQPARNECLVLENLCSLGYRMWNRKKMMAQNHQELMLATFAKFHGISYAMRKLRPSLLEELNEKYLKGAELQKKLEEQFGADGFSQSFKSVYNVFDLDNPEERPIRIALEKYVNETMKTTLGYAVLSDKYSALIQGDCWCNNMMFKYEDPNDLNSLLGMKLLDFQMTKVASPVLDLSYCFYASASKEAFDNLDYFRNFYHRKLAEYLKQYNIDVEEVYPYEVFIKHWDEMATFGLCCCFIVRKIMICESDEAPDINSLDDKTTILEKFDFETKYEDEYRRQMKELITHFYDRKMI